MAATMILTPFTIALAALCLLASQASGGEIAGRLALRTRPPAPASAPSRAASASSVKAEPAPDPVPIVYVESAPVPPGGFPAPAEPPRIEIRGVAFQPREAVVLAGGTIEFANRDDLFHSVFSYSPG